MRSKSFSSVLRERSDVSVTTSLMPVVHRQYDLAESWSMNRLTWVLGVFRTHVLVTRVQDILVHECCARSDLPEETNFDRLANLDSLTLLHKDLSGIFTSVFAIKTGHAVLFRMVAFLERLERSHEIMSTGDTGRDDSFCDTGSDSAFDDGRD